MKKYVLWIVAATMLFATGAAAQVDRPFGIGIIAGEPTGVSLKYYLNRVNALQGSVAWSLGGNNDVQIDGDYLFHRYELISVEKGELPVYFGVGATVSFRESKDNIVGIRFPVGLDYIFEGAPIDVFVQIVPVFEVAPKTDIDIGAALGIRFFF